jgi:hypothetical protein
VPNADMPDGRTFIARYCPNSGIVCPFMMGGGSICPSERLTLGRKDARRMVELYGARVAISEVQYLRNLDHGDPAIGEPQRWSLM